MAAVDTIFPIPGEYARPTSPEGAAAPIFNMPEASPATGAEHEIAALEASYAAPAYGEAEPTPEITADVHDSRAEVNQYYANYEETPVAIPAQRTAETAETLGATTPEAQRWPTPEEGVRYGRAFAHRVVHVWRAPVLQQQGEGQRR